MHPNTYTSHSSPMRVLQRGPPIHPRTHTQLLIESEKLQRRRSDMRNTANELYRTPNIDSCANCFTMRYQLGDIRADHIPGRGFSCTPTPYKSFPPPATALVLLSYSSLLHFSRTLPLLSTVFHLSVIIACDLRCSITHIVQMKPVPVVVRNQHMYDCSGWVKIRHSMFSPRIVWYMRLAGSTLTLHRKFDSPMSLEYSVIGCSVSKNILFPRWFVLRLCDGTHLRIGCNAKTETTTWKEALARASSLEFEQRFALLDQVEARDENATRTLFNAVDKFDGSLVWVHRIRKDPSATPETSDFRKWEELSRHLYACRDLGHHSLHWARSTFNEAHYAYIVTRQAGGKRLSDLIAQRGGCLPEPMVRTVTKLLLEALASMHTNGYVHRNVNLHSIWCDGLECGDIKVVLSEFEHVGFVDDEEDLRVKGEVGDALYMAPEMMRNTCYNASVDMFALGVLVYRMLTGSFPYKVEIERRSEAVDEREREVSCEEEVWKSVSSEGREFVGTLLKPDWMKRPTVTDALTHQWFATSLCEPSPRCVLEHGHTEKEMIVEGEGRACEEVLAGRVINDGVSRVKEVHSLLEQDEILLSPVMKRLLSPLSDDGPLSAKSVAEAFTRCRDR
eukprot:TRINITY_DN274_c0_g1_i1.p1 TRINITY_DN274_c0_g1~~TRINITY_DN274_c0_g1_i1.p1  ORF type:complete len:618 (+),score=59.37 TRINITY_DN274_c0_g1_i1:3485-5338(+)